MKHTLLRLWTDESGQDLVEYALLVVLLTLVVIVTLNAFGPTISGFFNSIGTNLEGL